MPWRAGRAAVSSSCCSGKWHAARVPEPLSSSGGSSCEHSSCALGSGCGSGTPRAGWPGSARRRSAAAGPRRGGRGQPPGRPPAARPCMGGAGSRTAASPGPISTIRPRYMTATRSHMWRTTDRSWAMNTSVRPKLALQVAQQVQHLRLDRDVQRRDGLVGDQQLRFQRQRAGDADPLALAAGELVRVAVVVLGVQPDRLHQLLHRAPARRLVRVRGRGSRTARR